MSEGNNKQYILTAVDSEHGIIKDFLEESFSNREKLINLSNYFDLIFSSDNENIINAFLPEFIENYTRLLNQYEPYYINPAVTNKILEVATKIISLNTEYINLTIISNHIIRIEEQLKYLTNILNGTSGAKQDGMTFPVLESDNQLNNQYSYGILESISVQIRKNKSGIKFLIIPSESQLEEKIAKQINDAWENALNYLKNNKVITLNTNYEVLIAFDRKAGILVGNSLGVVLTIAFIEELLRYHNSKMIVDAKENIAMTGGIDESGKIISTSKEIIRVKTEVVFYSLTRLFCVPKANELAAEEKLKELKKDYPNRNLEIVGLVSIDDLLNRRNIVEIRKIKLAVRTGKFIRKNWISAVATVLLAIIFAYMYVIDFDVNPSFISARGENLLIKNKNGKVLWTKNVKYAVIAENNSNYLNSYCRIYDINKDGVNEVLIAGEIIESVNKIIDNTFISCFDHKGILIWQYKFEDEVLSKRENLGNFYSFTIIDTITMNNKSLLYLIASNQSTFSSAIFPIDISKGEKCAGIFWCSGHTNAAVIKDYNSNGKPDIIAAGVDNGYEQQVLFAFEIDTLNVSRKSIDDYFIFNYPEAKTLAYVRFPKTDVDIYFETRIPGVSQGSFYYDYVKQAFRFSTYNDDIGENAHLWIEVDKSLIDVNVIVDNQYRVLRDTLVAKGKLNSPLTDTKEYKQIYKDNILYLQHGKWAKRDELK